MSTRKKPKNFVQRLLRRIWRSFNFVTQALLNWVLRSFMVPKRRRSHLSQSGFVLPTVVMVLLVVVLLTTAIVIRSFDRAKNASNFRVSETVLNAATPAMDRARAKLEYMFSPSETNLQGNTPPEVNIDQVLQSDKYNFKDEMRLRLADNSPGGPATLDTAWKFPVDTDNNGLFDSYTLYGIYFKNPGPADNRARTPLEARALPQEDGSANNCGGAGVAGGTAGWYQTSGRLKKAFFIYVATVPIRQVPAAYKDIPSNRFEVYRGNQGFSALEMQQDIARISLDNNAVWFDDDLILNATPTIRLNGRVHTNGNLMVSNPSGLYINFLQVSSAFSCYYDPENAKIVVGGNVAAGGPGALTNIFQPAPDTDFNNDTVRVDLHPGAEAAAGVAPTTTELIDRDNKTTTTAETPLQVASNSDAFSKRLSVLVEGALTLHDAVATPAERIAPTVTSVNRVTQFPLIIQRNFQEKCNDDANGRNCLRQTLDTYFRERIRRVSYAEVPITAPKYQAVYAPGGTTILVATNPAVVPSDLPLGTAVQFVFNGQALIAPPRQWMEIDEANTQVSLAYAGNTMKLPASEPTGAREEVYIGDRIKVGNGLPSRWLKNTTPDTTTGEPYTYAQKGDPGQPVTNNGTPIRWNNTGTQRRREGVVQVLDDLGDTSRGGFWEQAAAKLPGGKFETEDLAGGLRVITGAGIYIDDGKVPAGTLTMGRRIRDTDLTPDGRFYTDAASTTLQNPTLLTDVKTFLPAPPKPSELQAQGIKIPDLPANRVNNNPAATTIDDYFIVVWPDTMPMYQFSPFSPWDYNRDGSPQIAEGLKGDLQMRATVVYHYTNGDLPLACISSYYDPTDKDTAQNNTRWTNNGINYPVPARPANIPLTSPLRTQARMIFPDGRWVNENLRKAIEDVDASTPIANLPLHEKAAIDAANCALTILNPGSAPGGNGKVRDGAIVERAFLDARQIKAVHRTPNITSGTTLADFVYDPDPGSFLPSTTLPPATPPVLPGVTAGTHIANPDTLNIATLLQVQLNPRSDYSLPLEQRQPLEVRVTEINLNQLRGVSMSASNSGSGEDDNEEFLFPNSGIIYASRDDALPDISDPAGGASATDFKLDPTRHPNGIRLVNGENLERKTFFRKAEKGLILVSDEPVYIKGDFNLHYKSGSTTPVEEFTTLLNMPPAGPAPGNFYTRAGRDPDFACRRGGNPCGATGDQWRAARILSDAVTLLSNNFRDGFRSEGDYNLNNNAGNFAVKPRLKNGFWWNSFATTAISDTTAGSPTPSWYDTADPNRLPKDFDTGPGATGRQGSSYVTNNVTPIQRRVPIDQGGFRQYLMEACPKQPVSECGPQDWFVAMNVTNTTVDKKTAAQVPNLADPTIANYDRAGTTSQPPTVRPTPITTGGPTGIFQDAVRRVAFRRNEFGALKVLDPTCSADTPANLAKCTATPIGVNGTATVDAAYTATPTLPIQVDNALWYWTTSDNTNPSAFDPAQSYNSDNNLYYLPYDPEPVSERQLLLPGTPEFPDALQIPSLNGASVVDALHPSLYSETNPSDYAVCTATQLSKSYQVVGGLVGTPCPAITQVNTTYLKLRYTGNAVTTTPPVPGSPLYGVMSVQPFPIPDVNNGGRATLRATAKINFFTLYPQWLGTVPGGTFTLDRGNQSDPIFVIRTPTDQALAFPNSPVTLQLNGVDPNNIFWVSDEGNIILGAGAAHKLAGNFMGLVSSTSKFNFLGAPDPGLSITGRILGFSDVVGMPPNVMTAMTTTDQPLLVPVLNLHSANGAPSTNAASTFPGLATTDRWLSEATPTTFNAVFVMGDSPSRPLPGVTTNPAESGGGLNNFPRFLEKWEELDATANDEYKARISGGFIQFKKSIFATAPFEPIDDPARDSSLFFDGANPAYTAQSSNPQARDYRYKGGANVYKAPFYRAPVREWGYDVGLLSQTADLYSRRFVAPSAGKANEFYREVGRDDRWVKTLLCASQKNTAGTYEPALTAKDRPSGCVAPPA